MNNLLIIGGSGILGSSLISECQFRSVVFEAPQSSILDIRNEKQVNKYFSKLKPDAVINCAAWTDVENSELEYMKALELNYNAVKNIVLAAKNFSIPLVHLSTDYVFKGDKLGKYSEEDETIPINNYGKSKLLGEKILLELYPGNSYLIRTSWLYGTTGKNFVKFVLKKALLKETISVVNDQIGSPTNSDDLAQGIIAMLQEKPPTGIYHYSNYGEVSWFEFASKIYELAEADPQLVAAISSKSFPSKVRRPCNSVLSTDKWRAAKISEINNWDESLVRIFPRLLELVSKAVHQ